MSFVLRRVICSKKNVQNALQNLFFFLWIKVISFPINAWFRPKGIMDHIIVKIQDIRSEKEECN